MQEPIFEDTRKENPDIKHPFTCHRANSERGSYYCFPHWHYYIEIIYVLSAKAKIIIGGKSYTLLAGDMALINAREVHAIFSDEGDYNSIVIKFDPQVLYPAATSTFELKYVLPFIFENSKHQKVFTAKEIEDTPIPELVKEIFNESSNKEYGYELAVRIDTGRIFLWILRGWKKNNLLLKFSVKETDIQKFEPVFNYIDQNYSQDIKVKTLAKMSTLSYSYFCRQFKEVTGKTFTQYLNHVRITEAEKLLLSTELNITQIALNVGFSDPNYFIRVFKSIKKISPKQYRKKLQM